MTTDTTEKNLERLICTALTGSPCEPAKGAVPAVNIRRERLDLRQPVRLQP